MAVLVTGGGGFLGRHLVEQLLQRGESVRILSRHAYPDLARGSPDLRQAGLALSNA